jgi:hypothetical protein
MYTLSRGCTEGAKAVEAAEDVEEPLASAGRTTSIDFLRCVKGWRSLESRGESSAVLVVVEFELCVAVEEDGEAEHTDADVEGFAPSAGASGGAVSTADAGKSAVLIVVDTSTESSRPTNECATCGVVCCMWWRELLGGCL